jgi:hypothetical protein
VIPAVDFFPGSTVTQWQGNLDAAIRIDRRGLLYVGTGIALLNAQAAGSWVRDVGWNLFAGIHLEGEGSKFGLFAEPRWTVTEGKNPFYFALGVTLAL